MFQCAGGFHKDIRNDTHVDQQVQREIDAILQKKTWQCISKFAYLSLGISSLNKTGRGGEQAQRVAEEGCTLSPGYYSKAQESSDVHLRTNA